MPVVKWKRCYTSMCNGFKHTVGCHCGFGGEGHLGGRHVGTPRSPDAVLPRGTLRRFSLPDLATKLGRSLVIPTNCRYCGTDIYLFASPNGGFAVFDELGIPWPKHSCWDSLRHGDWTVKLENSRHSDFKIPCPSGVIYYPFWLASGSHVSGTIMWVKHVEHPRGIEPLVQMDLLNGRFLHRFSALVELSVGSHISGEVAQVGDVGTCLVNIEQAEYCDGITGTIWTPIGNRAPKRTAQPPVNDKSSSDAKNLEKCPQCGVEVGRDRMARHVAKRCPVTVRQPVIDNSSADARNVEKCLHCGVEVSIGRMARHVAKRCPVTVGR
jgi:hypothetical protein